MTTTQNQTTVLAVLTSLNPASQQADLLIKGTAKTIRCSTAAFNIPQALEPFLYTALHCNLSDPGGGPDPDLLEAYPAKPCKLPAEEAKDLRTNIRSHDMFYYQDNNPVTSDTDYDLLMQRLTFLEHHYPEVQDPHSPTQRVSGQPASTFKQVQHPAPMLSLANAFNQEDFLAWHKRVADQLGDPHFPMHLELKIDGIAVRVVYREGKMVMAATRGNGTAGEDVTHTVRTVRNLPLILLAYRGDTEVRGEIYLPRSTFHRLNEERKRHELEPYANPRNAAAGAVRQLDPKAASDRGIMAWLYSSPDTGKHTQGQALDSLKALGLPVNPVSASAISPQEVFDFYNRAVADRQQWDYDADGVVIKVDSFESHQALGATGREPRWAIAWKFPPEQVTTTLQRIEISHGRFGKLTPVAVLDPVQVGGVTVRNATLHNEQDIHRKNIREGAAVLLERAGDVIPQVTGPADPEQNDSLPVFHMPEHCPSCGTQVTQPQGDAAHWCLNQDCPAKLPEQIRHFVGKSAMDIDGLGTHWCEAFIERDMVSKPADVYRLTRKQLLSLPRMGEKLADRIMTNLETSREQPFQRVLYSLGIFRLGREVSTLLSQRHDSIEEVMALTVQELTDMEGIGPVIADSVFNGLRYTKVRDTIDTMRDCGVTALQPQDPATTRNREENKETEPMTQTDNPLKGKTVVVTGKLEHLTRLGAEDAIRSRGGKPSGSVTGNTDYLVVGEKPGSKLDKARKLGVTVLEEEQFTEMLGG